MIQIPPCSWQRGPIHPATMTITAGTPGTGHYYTGGACDQHETQIRQRATNTSGHANLRVQRIPDTPAPTEDQEQLAIDL